jgi:Zn/Cd-binding protein ZinT
MKIFRTAFIHAVLLIGLAGPLLAADVTGKWKADFDTGVGHLNYVYDLKLEGETLTGKAIRTLDDAKTETDIQEGKVVGDTVSFVEIAKILDNDLRIEYTGKVAGDEMKLTRKVGDFGSEDIVAKRAPDTAPVLVGKWKAEFDTQIGHLDYIYEFKAEGDKLTGKAARTLADVKTETDVQELKLAGDTVTFAETVNNQGNDVRIDYTGKIAGDEIKFTRKVADIATTEIVAKRIKEPAKESDK